MLLHSIQFLLRAAVMKALRSIGKGRNRTRAHDAVPEVTYVHRDNRSKPTAFINVEAPVFLFALPLSTAVHTDLVLDVLGVQLCTMSSLSSDQTVHAPSIPQAADSVLDVEDTASPHITPSSSQPIPRNRRPSGRVSFSTVLQHRPSFVSRWRNNTGDEESGPLPSPKPERPPIPSALQPPPEMYSTPLPMLSIVVLSIVSLLSPFDRIFS